MDEMHTTTDYVKSIWALGLIEIVIYTLTGALIYAFVGQEYVPHTLPPPPPFSHLTSLLPKLNKVNAVIKAYNPPPSSPQAPSQQK
jgi:hypothetical protein